MPDPQKHAQRRGWIESIARWIPGFSGYLEREYRRDSDALARKWMADQLDQSKPKLNEYMKRLTEAGKLSALNECQSFLTRLDTIVGKFRSAPSGYSGFFDFVQIGEDELDKVYEIDVTLFKSVEGLSKGIAALAQSDEDPQLALAPLKSEMDAIEQHFQRRIEVLQGLGEQ